MQYSTWRLSQSEKIPEGDVEDTNRKWRSQNYLFVNDTMFYIRSLKAPEGDLYRWKICSETAEHKIKHKNQRDRKGVGLGMGRSTGGRGGGEP